MELAMGKSIRETAKEVDLSPMWVWETKNKAEVKALIEQYQKEFLAANLDKSIERMTEYVHKDVEKKDHVGRKIQYSAVQKTLESASVLPSQAPSVYIEQLNQVNMFQTPEVKNLMGRFAGYLAGKESVVEAEVVNGKGGAENNETEDVGHV
jgi:DNA-binding Lrp family transcriptional regulator